MPSLIEHLKQGVPDAKTRLDEAQRKFANAQAEFQLAQQRLMVAQTELQNANAEHQAYMTLLNTLQRREQGNAEAPQIIRIPNQQVLHPGVVVRHPAMQAHIIPNVAQPPPPTPVIPNAQTHELVSVEENNREPSQTGIVREVLKANPAGMTPAEIWPHVRERISNRVYLYSILKRLRARGDVRERRGKYYYLSAVVEESPKTAIPAS